MTCPVHSATVTATGTGYAARARVKGITFVCTATAGSIVFKNNGASGTTLIDLATPAAVGFHDVMIPNDGVLFDTDVHLTLTNVTSVTFFYE